MPIKKTIVLDAPRVPRAIRGNCRMTRDTFPPVCANTEHMCKKLKVLRLDCFAKNFHSPRITSVSDLIKEKHLRLAIHIAHVRQRKCRLTLWHERALKVLRIARDDQLFFCYRHPVRKAHLVPNYFQEA